MTIWGIKNINKPYFDCNIFLEFIYKACMKTLSWLRYNSKYIPISWHWFSMSAWEQNVTFIFFGDYRMNWNVWFTCKINWSQL